MFADPNMHQWSSTVMYFECSTPSKCLREAIRDQRNSGAAQADTEISKAHRFAPRAIKPLRQQNLIRQRSAAHIAEGIDQVEGENAARRTNGCTKAASGTTSARGSEITEFRIKVLSSSRDVRVL